MTTNEQQEPLFFCGTETWKDIVGYEGIYQISDLGQVRSLRFEKTKILKQSMNSDGYMKIQLTNKEGISSTYYVHRLVAITFVSNDNFEEKIYVNHKNHNRSSNVVENLEWVTPAENIDAIAKQRMSASRKGKSNLYLRKRVRCLEDDTNFDSLTDCARTYNINQSSLSTHLRGRSKTCKGRHFEYA